MNSSYWSRSKLLLTIQGRKLRTICVCLPVHPDVSCSALNALKLKLTAYLYLASETDHDELDIMHADSASVLLGLPVADPGEPVGVYRCEHPELRSGDSVAQQITQSRAFCGWITWVLQRQNPTSENVQDLGLALTSGTIIGPLLQQIADITVEGLVEAQSAYDKITNLNLVMDAFELQYPSASLPSASAVASNNPKASVDFAWQLFYHSTLKTLQYCGLEDRFALLLWIQHTVSSFTHISLISDFTQSLSDGLAICAIIESKAPNSVDTRNLTNIQRTDNLRKAFDLAEQLFHIPKFLAPMDVISPTPDEVSILVFLTMLHKS